MCCCFNEMRRTNSHTNVFIWMSVCVCMCVKLMQHDKGFRKGWNANVVSSTHTHTRQTLALSLSLSLDEQICVINIMKGNKLLD